MKWKDLFKDIGAKNPQNINISDDIEFQEPWENRYGPPEKKMLKVMIPVSRIWGWGKKIFKKR